MVERLNKLLTVKSIVTILLTIVFCVMSLRGTLDSQFLTIFTTVIAFYFGTQAEKKNSESEGN